MSRLDSVVLLSGGLDSAANLAFCAHYDKPMLAVTVDYGHRAAGSELKASRALCEFFGVTHQVVDATWLKNVSRSALTATGVDIPHLSREQLNDSERTEQSAAKVWVPNRNNLLIQIAACFAENLSARQVVVGFNREEAATFPDNSSAFISALNLGLKYSTRNHVRCFSYTDMMDKRQIVEALDHLPQPFPYDRVWSCYHGGDQPCNQCESCQRQLRAYQYRIQRKD